MHDAMVGGTVSRLLVVRRGPVTVRLDVVPGQRFGGPRRVERWSGGIAFGGLIARGLPEGEDVVLQEGDRVVVALEGLDEHGVVHRAETYASLDANLLSRARGDAESAATRILGSIAYDGPYLEAVRNSVRMLRLLTDRRSGALVASPCTSLPPRIGNDRNVDHRYAYLRENARAVRLWERLECFDWADATRHWLSGVVGDELPLAPCYNSGGDRPSGETETDLHGWESHTPIRVGSRAAEGLDLAGFAEAAMALDPRRQSDLIERLCSWLADHPLQPDHGRWDERTRPKVLTASQLAVRAALVDRAGFRPPLDGAAVAWTDTAKELAGWVVAEAMHGARPATVVGRSASDPTVDAALLRWLDVDLPGDVGGERTDRMRATVDTALAQLGEGPYCHRFAGHVDDGFPPGISPDVAASFEMVSALTKLGRWEAAHDRMLSLVSFVGPLGLAPTFADPASGEYRGNLCSAAAALALVDAALDLNRGPK